MGATACLCAGVNRQVSKLDKVAREDEGAEHGQEGVRDDPAGTEAWGVVIDQSRQDVI
jgi:hypothetical protein